MSCVLTVQTQKYGAITAIDLLHEGRLVASLIKENTNLVDYSGRRIFQDIDTAIEFYRTQVDPDRNSWTLRIGSLTARTAFFVHHSTSSFPLRYHPDSKVIQSPGSLPFILTKEAHDLLERQVTGFVSN